MTPQTQKGTDPMSALNERVLPDDYPVYAGYLYVADGNVIESDIEGTVKRLKACLSAAVITNCDIYGRQAIAKAKADEAQHGDRG